MNNKETAFVQFAQVNALITRSQDTTAGNSTHFSNNSLAAAKVSLQSIVNTILHPHEELAKSNLTLINRSVLLRKLFNESLEDLAVYTTDLQIAADSASVSKNTIASDIDWPSLTRKGNGFELRFIPANQRATEIFVLLVIDDPAKFQKREGVFVHARWQNTFYVWQLQRASEGKFQSLVNNKSQIFNACFDSSTHWFII